MSETLLANLFFIITGSAIIAVGVLLCVVLYQVLKVVKLVRGTMERIHTSTELIVEDVKALHQQIADGSVVGRVFAALISGAARTTKRRTTRKKKDVTNEE